MRQNLLPVLVAVILVAQGCAMSLSEIRALGPRGQAEINQPYVQAASCVLQQIDNRPNDLIIRNARVVINHTVFSHHDKEYVEIAADPMVGGKYVGGMYLVSVRSRGPNSSVAEIYVSNNLIRSGAVADRIKQVASSCNR